MMKMKLLEVVTPPSIYHGCSTWNKFWEEKFTGEEKLFSAVNMKCFGRRNVRKHWDIKVSDKYVTLVISLKIDILENIKITSSESKDDFGRSGKEFITSLGIKAKVRPHKYKNASYAIGNVSKKDLSEIIREFEIFPYESYERKTPKHEPIDSYFYLSRHILKCIVIAYSLNLYGCPVRTGITATKQIPTSHVCSTDKIELKDFPFNETLLRSCSKDKDESKGIIIN